MKNHTHLPSHFNWLTIIIFIGFLINLAVYSTSARSSDFSPDPYWSGTLGPLTIRSLSPAQSLRFSPIPRSPYGLPENQTELQFNFAVASVFIEEPGQYLMDFHFTDTRFAIRRGFKNNWSAEISFNNRRIINAYLDGPTKDVHNFFGVDQNGRDEVEENDTHIFIPSYNIDLGKEIRGSFSKTIGLSIQKVLIDKSVRWPAIAVNFNISYETLGNGFIEDGSTDYGVQFSIAQKRSGGYIYGNVSFTRFGSDNWGGVPLSEDQFSGLLGYELTTDENQAIIFQYLFSEGVVEDLSALEEYSHEIHLGYKWRTNSLLWEVGIVENIVNFDNSPDVAFTLGVTYRL